jgi:hypothetical protein
MAYDLFFQAENDQDFSINLPGQAKAPSLNLEFSKGESKALKLLEPSTRAFVVDVIGWARSKGIPAKLSSQSVIYTEEDSAKHFAEGRSGIAPGRLDWHNVGRAFHLVILDGSGKLDLPAYARVGDYVRNKGGEWLGDKRIKTPKGWIVDTAHYEYHPGFDIATYRKSSLAQTEFAQAQARAKKYA